MDFDICSDMSWKVMEKLGSGWFGDVFKCIHNAEVRAMKRSAGIAIERTAKPEFNILKYLEHESAGRCVGIPRAYSFSVVNGAGCMIMDLLGPSLKDIQSKRSKFFSVKTTFQIADQLLVILESIHRLFVFHCDIKAANVVIGPNRSSESNIYLVDFGSAERLFTQSTRNPGNEDNSFRERQDHKQNNFDEKVLTFRRTDLTMLVNMMKGFLEPDTSSGTDEGVFLHENLICGANDSMKTIFPRKWGGYPPELRDFESIMCSSANIPAHSYENLRLLLRSKFGMGIADEYGPIDWP